MARTSRRCASLLAVLVAALVVGPAAPAAWGSTPPVDGYGARCSSGIPDGAPLEEGPGRETFVEASAPSNGDRALMRAGTTYRADVAMFAVPERVDGAVVWLSGPRLRLIGTPVVRLVPGDPLAESLIRMRVRLPLGTPARRKMTVRVCVALIEDGVVVERRGADLRLISRARR